MVSKRVGNALIVVGLITLVVGIGMPSTNTIRGSTDVPESCVDTGFGDECFGGGEIQSETTVENPSKGPTIVGGLFLTLIGFVVRAGASGKEHESNDETFRSFRKDRQQVKDSQYMNDTDRTAGNQPMDTDGGSSTDSTTTVNQQSRSSTDNTDTRRQQTQRQVGSNQQQSDIMDFIQKYDSEIKYYGSVIVGIIVVDFLVSFLFGPTFIMDGFLGRVVTLLSWIVGGMAGLRFHERQFQ